MTAASREGLALVTGGAGGIGRALCDEFAQRGYDLIVVDRLADDLTSLGQELASRYPGIGYTPHVMDLAQADAAERLFDWCEQAGLRVDFLVNNVGFGKMGEHVEQSVGTMRDVLTLNNLLMTNLCILFGRQMKQRRGGRILNVASMVGFSSSPYFSAYSGTKAYAIAFSVGLAREMGEYGVSVSCLCPGTTETRFLDVAKTDHASSGGVLKFVSAFIANPQIVARAGAKGALKGQLIIVPTLFLRLQAVFLRALPIEWVSGFVHRKVRYADAPTTRSQ